MKRSIIRIKYGMVWYGNCLHDINKRHSENLRVTLLF